MITDEQIAAIKEKAQTLREDKESIRFLIENTQTNEADRVLFRLTLVAFDLVVSHYEHVAEMAEEANERKENAEYIQHHDGT